MIRKLLLAALAALLLPLSLAQAQPPAPPAYHACTYAEKQQVGSTLAAADFFSLLEEADNLAGKATRIGWTRWLDADEDSVWEQLRLDYYFALEALRLLLLQGPYCTESLILMLAYSDWATKVLIGLYHPLNLDIGGAADILASSVLPFTEPANAD